MEPVFKEAAQPSSRILLETFYLVDRATNISKFETEYLHLQTQAPSGGNVFPGAQSDGSVRGDVITVP